MGAEKNVENRIKNALKANNYWYTKIFANEFTKKGIPDILAVVNGQMVALEIKRPTGGKPTPIQVHNLQAIANNQGLAIITNDPNIVDKLTDIKNHMKLPNVFYQPAVKQPLTPTQAASLWRHPLKQATPKQPYSVVISSTKKEV